MSALQFKLTQSGVAIIASTRSFTIDAVGFGDRGYAPTGAEMALQSQRERVAVTSGAVNGNTITLEPILTSNRDFLIREIGIYLDDGTLFALWSSTSTTAGHKTQNSQFQILMTLIIEGVSADRVDINVVEFGHANLVSHIENTDNPHEVTCEQIGALEKTGKAANSADSELLGGKDGKIYAPPGAVISFAKTAAPSGWLECNGASLSRTVYADLYAVLGTVFGDGGGSTTFALPDFRGEFVRGWDHGRGVDSGRNFGSAQVDMFKSHRHSALRHVGSSAFVNYSTSPNGNSGPSGYTGKTGGSETRPRNIALLFCIKY